MKVLPTALIGAIISAIVLGLSAAIVVIVEDTTGTLGLRGRDFWWLAFILGLLFGAVIGGIEGVIVSYFQINILWTIIFGLGFGLLCLMFFALGDTALAADANHQRFFEIFVIWQVIYPAVISVFSTFSNSSD